MAGDVATTALELVAGLEPAEDEEVVDVDFLRFCWV